MRKLILTALVAATVMPVAAEAQSRGDLRRDRREIRDDRRDLREDRRDFREDRNRRWGDNDWRTWRNTNRNVYARGNWRAPFRYNAFRVGVRIAPTYYGSSYWLADPWRYRLPPAGYGERWVRHYDDLLLVDTRRGIVLRVINNFYW
ncbi:RcnB family protein [Sphingomonas panacisoli]|uniref:RcnB family protein n=1 Tax=Sphingomonas panacisoli TaxID=1813879 RepID=A0A5B8LKS7_9SPHN|nr:RcnB family protein [Sphingomonas panacisoli]QDZ08529.1 RcnB family protein [Sphingomonas panacisoli]